METNSESPAPETTRRLVDANTDECLEGPPSAALIEASDTDAANNGTGIVLAYYRNRRGEWDLLSPELEDNYRNVFGHDVRSVYVAK